MLHKRTEFSINNELSLLILCENKKVTKKKRHLFNNPDRRENPCIVLKKRYKIWNESRNMVYE